MTRTESLLTKQSAKPRGWRFSWSRSEDAVLGVSGIVLLLLAWEVAADVGWLNPGFSSSPSRIVGEAAVYFRSDGFATDVKASVTEFGWGYSISAVVGIPIGLLMGYYRRIRSFLDPLVSFLNSMPHVAMMPLFIIWFGLGNQPIIALVVTITIFTVIITVIGGVGSTDIALVRMGKSFGASDLTIFWTVILPGVVPTVVAALRLALGKALIGLVVGELVSSTKGIGHEMVVSASLFNTDRVFVGIVLVAAVGVILTELLRVVERRMGSWRSER